MSVYRRSIRAIPVVAGLLALSSTVAVADEPLFSWSGTVDREVLVVFGGRQVDTRGVDSRLPSSSRVFGAVPRTGYGDVQVRLESGRGTVIVVEQPTSRNGYQTVVRLSDPQGGADRYRLVAYWTGDDRGGRNGTYDNRGNNDNRGGYDNGRGKDDRRGDDRRGDGRGDNRGGDGRYPDRRDDDRGNNGRGNGRWDNNGRGNDGRGNNGKGNNGKGNNGKGTNGKGTNGKGTNGGYDSRNAGSGTLRWSGNVDAVVDITIQGRNVNYITRSGASTTNVRARVEGGALPRDARVTVVGAQGRGNVQVIQQPNAYNGYTAVIRVTDSRSGAGQYDVEARW